MESLINVDYASEFNSEPISGFIPAPWLLAHINLSAIADEVLRKCYNPNVKSYFHYPVETMIRIVVLACWRHLTYRKIEASLSEEDMYFLFPAGYAGKFPAPSTIHHFVKYRLYSTAVWESHIIIEYRLRWSKEKLELYHQAKHSPYFMTVPYISIPPLLYT